MWLVSFNPAKSESLLFSRKINKSYHPPVTMNNQIITEVTTLKHLSWRYKSVHNCWQSGWSCPNVKFWYGKDQWAKKWLVSFNPAKSESHLFSRRIIKPYHPPVTMNNQIITEVTTHKHLGLTFSNDCTWHEHLAQIKTKAWQRINIMRKLKFVLDRKSLQTIYFSFIRPVLEYADVVWDNCTQYEAGELEKILIEAARVVTGATRLVSLNLLYCETGWDTCARRRNKQ